jgi:F-type H+-transporting ATPase subunit gamma
MGASMKDIKGRIKSVESTMQITKAMELVSSSKLRKAKERAESARPFFNVLYETISDLSAELDGTETIYTAKPGDLPSLYIVIAGDRGLAGGYNANVFRLLAQQPDHDGAKVIAIGRKAVEKYAHAKDVEMIGAYPGLAEQLRIPTVTGITDTVLTLFQQRKIGRVRIIFTQFVTAMTQRATMLDILPLSQIREKRTYSQAMNYEPGPGAVFASIIPQYVTGMIYGAVTESYASEQGARRTAMESATGNAEEMIKNLSLSYNRARQAAITQELTEIVSGANAAQ